jgi:hypothetical protein
MSKNTNMVKGELDAAVDRFRSAYAQYRKGEREKLDASKAWARMATRKAK